MHQILEHLESKRHVIWDWNGTLLDDVDLAVAAISEVLAQNGLTPIDRDGYRKTFCFPISEYYRRLGFDTQGTAYETATRQFVASYAKLISAGKLHAGTEAVLKTVKERGMKQSILSAAHESDLHKLLSHFQIAPYFDHVYGLSDHYAASKMERGKDLLKACGVSPSETLLIGDTDHDWEVGSALGVEVLLLCDGHQHEDRLQSLRAKRILRR